MLLIASADPGLIPMTSMVAVVGNAEPDTARDNVAEQVGIAIAEGRLGISLWRTWRCHGSREPRGSLGN